MLCGEEVAVCYEINTKHISVVWTECTVQFLNVKTVGARKQ